MKLKTCLDKIPRRTVRDAFQRIVGDGDKVKGAIKQMCTSILKKPKFAFAKWAKFTQDVKKKTFFDALRSSQLKERLYNITRRTISRVSQIIQGDGDKVKGALKCIVSGLKNVPRKSLRSWVHKVEDIKHKNLFDNARTAKLKNALERLLRRTTKDTTERIKGVLFVAPTVRKTIRRMEQLLKKRPKAAFDRWRKYAYAVNTKMILNSVKSLTLKTKLEKSSKRTVRDAFQRIVGEGDKVKGAIKQIYRALQKKPKLAYDI